MLIRLVQIKFNPHENPPTTSSLSPHSVMQDVLINTEHISHITPCSNWYEEDLEKHFDFAKEVMKLSHIHFINGAMKTVVGSLEELNSKIGVTRRQLLKG